MRRLLAIGCAALCLLPLSAQTANARGQGMIPVGARVASPDFTLTDVQGKTMTLSHYKGKVVLLDFWATTCGAARWSCRGM